MLVRLSKETDQLRDDLAALVLLAATVGVPMPVSMAFGPVWLDGFVRWSGADARIEPVQECSSRILQMTSTSSDRPGPSIRTIGPVEAGIAASAATHDIPLVSHPLVSNARIELLPFLVEQSLSETLHRYGNATAVRSESVVTSSRLREAIPGSG